MRIHITAIGLAAVMLALGACSSSTAGSGGTLEGVTWALTSFVVNGEKQAVPEGVTVDATFQAADSTVSGSGGCNRYFGQVTEKSPGAIAIGPLAGTRMACHDPAMELETRFYAAMSRATRYSFVGGRLVLSSIDGGVPHDLTFGRGN